ncbi:hypothetical protein Trydic_g11976 [Trypoxylus dichotomus]
MSPSYKQFTIPKYGASCPPESCITSVTFKPRRCDLRKRSPKKRRKLGKRWRITPSDKQLTIREYAASCKLDLAGELYNLSNIQAETERPSKEIPDEEEETRKAVEDDPFLCAQGDYC